MKRILATLALALVAVLALAQNSSVSSILRPRVEIAECSSEENNMEMEVFYMNDESPRMYYLSLGGLGVGTDIIQVEYDPVYEVFIPLGGNLEEALAKMKEIKALYNMPRRQSTEMTGYFSALYPGGEPVTFTVTSRRLLASKILEFSIPTATDGIVRATHVYKGNFNSLTSVLKIYKGLHPKE